MGGFAVIRFATVARTGRLPRPEGDPNLVASLILVRPDIDPREWLPAFAPIHLVGEGNSSHAGFQRAFQCPT